MDVFTIGLIVLAIMTVIFYIVIFSFIFYWHLVKVSFIVVPVIFTFEFFAMGFLIISLLAVIIQYAPALVIALGI